MRTDGYKEYKAVHILGLYSADLQTDNVFSRNQLYGEVWSMTDWYRSYPWLPTLDRHYDVHGAVEAMDRRFWKVKDKHRFPDDWVKKYRECNAKMVVWDMMWQEKLGLPEDRFLWLDYEMLEAKYGIEPMSSSISIMILDAVEADFERIWLHGLHMIGTDHEAYVPGVVKAMEIARESGIKITANYEHEWTKDNRSVKIENYARVCKEHQDKLRSYSARSREAAVGTKTRELVEIS